MSKADLVCSQLVIKATPAQLLLLFGQHPGSLLLGLGLLLGNIVTALLLELGALHVYDLFGILSKGGPIQNVQCQYYLHQQWRLSQTDVTRQHTTMECFNEILGKQHCSDVGPCHVLQLLLFDAKPEAWTWLERETGIAL